MKAMVMPRRTAVTPSSPQPTLRASPSIARLSWSDRVITEIETSLDWLRTTWPYLDVLDQSGRRKLELKSARGSTRGSDIVITVLGNDGLVHNLLIEVEQYASGNLQSKVAKWADRHFAVQQGSNTATNT